MAGPQGLQTSIWSNNIKSMLLLAVYPVILAAVMFAIVAAYGYYTHSAITYLNTSGIAITWDAAGKYSLFITKQYWPLIVTVVVIWFIVAYFFHGSIIRNMARSHTVTRNEEPQLYNLVENMCISQGMRMPRLEIIETHARNAFASGITESTYCVTVTRGLMQALTKDELEGVLAHELSHIINRDVRLMMVCIIFTGMIGVAAQLLWSNVRYTMWMPKRRENNGGMILLFVIGAILAVGYFASMLARFAISRSREYMADAGAVKITKNPDAMMRALIRISGRADVPKMPADLRAMCLESATPFLGLFATHPPIEKRIAAIAGYANIPVPDLRPKEPAGPDQAFYGTQEKTAPRDNWMTRQRFRHRRNANPWK